MLLLLKLIIVPLFIAMVTLAGKVWGTRVAGLLGGLPVVAGPIVIFLALEQGQDFGVIASMSAIASVAGLLAFGIAYSWLSLSRHWITTYVVSLLIWICVAFMLAQLTLTPILALCIAGSAMLLTPILLPKVTVVPAHPATLNDLPLRLIAGALLTLAVTQSAQFLGGRWSGILAVFPVIGSVLAVFTHRSQGANAVTQLYRGMVKGLCSLSLFFFILTFMWQNQGFWYSIIIAVIGALSVQLVLRLPIIVRLID